MKEECAVWGLAGTLIWGLFIALAFVVTQFIVMGVYIAYNYGGAASADIESQINNVQFNGTVLSFATFATLIVCGLLVIGVADLKKNSCIKQYLGLKKVDLTSIRYWFLVAVVFMIFSDMATLSLDKPVVPDFMARVFSTAEPQWFFWLALIFAAPVFEELFFRGFLLSGLCASFVGPVGAVIITSALWAVIHMQYELYLLLTIFVMGLILGTARLKTGSTYLTIGMHSLFNLVATIEAAIYLS
jgi:membrane protease YdiL (CAAX protease family)